MTDRDPGVVPMLAYADGIAALEWLADVSASKNERECWMEITSARPQWTRNSDESCWRQGPRTMKVPGPR